MSQAHANSCFIIHPNRQNFPSQCRQNIFSAWQCTQFYEAVLYGAEQRPGSGVLNQGSLLLLFIYSNVAEEYWLLKEMVRERRGLKHRIGSCLECSKFLKSKLCLLHCHRDDTLHLQRVARTSHKGGWPVFSTLRAWPLENQVRDRHTVVKARMRSEAM